MSELGSRPWRNPETRARLIEKIREHTNSKKHLALMAEHNKKLWANAEFRKHHAARTRRRAIEMWSNPEYRNQKSIETTKKNIERWADPKYKTRVSAAIRAAKATTMGKLRSSAAARAKMQCPERRAQAREIMTTRWQDSEYRTRMTEQSRATAIRSWNDPFFRARAIEQIRVTMQSPEHRARVSEQNKRLWADPEYRERQKKLRSDPEFKARAAERNRQRWADPKYRRRVSKAISKAKKGKPTWRSRETN
ncbi:MAG: hypothetical protein C5B60_00165 [Chloroflexi bacterium]|nr:MAG: hypothetical protein C5B60_00165 [Chloroflexota bacterium]